MEYVIRAVWDVETKQKRDDIDWFVNLIMDNINYYSQALSGNKEFFPIADREYELYEDDDGFRYIRFDMSKVISCDDDRTVETLMKTAKIILEHSGAAANVSCEQI